MTINENQTNETTETKLQRYKKAALKSQKSTIQFVVGSIILALVGSLLLYFKVGNPFILIGIIGGIISYFKLMSMGTKIDWYSEEAKKQIHYAQFSEDFDDFEFTAKGNYEQGMIDSTKLFITNADYESRDYLSVTYKGVRCKKMDTYARESYKTSDGKEAKDISFKGQVYTFNVKNSTSSGFFYADRKFNRKLRNQTTAEMLFDRATDYFFDKQFVDYLSSNFKDGIQTIIATKSHDIGISLIRNRLVIAVYSNAITYTAPLKDDKLAKYEKIIHDEAQYIKYIVDTLNLTTDVSNEI